MLAHIARNADALNNLLTWARTGVETPAYATPTARADGIEAGAYRPLDEQIDDIRDELARGSPRRPTRCRPTAGPSCSARQGSAARVVWRRLREVEVHHVDLDAGYAPADWPEAFTLRLLHELVHDRPRSAGAVPAVAVADRRRRHPLQLGAGTPSVTVSGPAHDAGRLAVRPIRRRTLAVEPDRTAAHPLRLDVTRCRTPETPRPTPARCRR